MKSRLNALAVAAGSLLTLTLVGCNPPVDDAGKGSTTPAVNPAPSTSSDATKPVDSTVAPAPAPTPVTPPGEAPKAETPATPPAEAPKIDAQPAAPTATPKDEPKKEETPKSL